MKCALVTGGSRGIGRSICLELATAGYYILVNYRKGEEEAAKTLDLIRQQGGDGELLPFDVGDKDQVQRQLTGWLEKDSGRHIEVLVNNAGIKDDALLLWMEYTQWSSVIRTNLDSFYFVTRAVLNGMLLKKYGRIINIVSLAGLKGQAGQTNYSAAKAGVIGATKALAAEVGRHGITVNAIAPGPFLTDANRRWISEKPEFQAEVASSIPLGRWGDPKDIGGLTLYLASEASAFMTGSVIVIDGGKLLW
jgi:3-oxoacyl-[acyl-carrier protein] reductase